TVFNRRITSSLRRPHLFTEFLLRHYAVTVRQKIGEHSKYFGSQSNRLASPAQEIMLGLEDAIRKEVAHGLDLSAPMGAHSSYDRTCGTQRSYCDAQFLGYHVGNVTAQQILYRWPDSIRVSSPRGNGLKEGKPKY